MRSRSANSGKVILFLHGGGYVAGSPTSHQAITSHLAVTTGASVLSLDYRLAPEHPYPAALDDALTAYDSLLRQFNPQHISIIGDSAGAGLTLCTALAIRDDGKTLPASLVLLSQWLDVTLAGDSVAAVGAKDPVLSARFLHRAADAYRGDLAPTDPRISPLFASHKGLPPILIQVGSDEILLSDSQQFAEKARNAAVEIELDVVDGMWHDFHLHAGQLHEADAAIDRIGAFLNTHWGPAATASEHKSL